MKTIFKIISTLAAATLVSTASAQIVYVDATDGAAGNTAIAPSAGGGVFTPVQPPGTQGPANDGLWDVRAFGNNASIYQNAGTGAGVDTNAVRLATSVSGLPLNSYDVYVYFWTDSSLNWRIGASLNDTPGQLMLYQAGGADVTQFYSGADATVFSSTLSPNPFTADVMVAEGNRRLLQAHLGSVTGTGFSVFVEGDLSMTSFDQRTWYDGIGYAVVPEPASAALFGLGALVFVLRRRRS